MGTQYRQDTIRVHRFLPVTEAEGPGKRSSLWVQGCERRCPGCFNSATWDRSAGAIWTIEQLSNQIEATEEIEGVTFVGGEPFLQATPLARLGLLCRERGLSVVTFTGYDYGDIQAAKRCDWNALLGVTDLLLAGPYIAEQQDFSRPWVGSSNQEFVFLTSRYQYLENQLESVKNTLELNIGIKGEISVNGMASEGCIDEIRQNMAALGLETQP